MPVEFADTMIRRPFAVGLALASCASIVDRTAAAHLLDAIAELDQIIYDLRPAVFDEPQSDPVLPVADVVDLRIAQVSLELFDQAGGADWR